MIHTRVAMAVAILLSRSPVAAAAEFGGATPCAKVVSSFDQQRYVPQIVTTITNVMVGLDDIHTNAGERGALAPLSDQGMTSVISLAVEDCREHPQKRLRDAAAKAYMELRATEFAINPDQ